MALVPIHLAPMAQWIGAIGAAGFSFGFEHDLFDPPDYAVSVLQIALGTDEFLRTGAVHSIIGLKEIVNGYGSTPVGEKPERRVTIGRQVALFSNTVDQALAILMKLSGLKTEGVNLLSMAGAMSASFGREPANEEPAWQGERLGGHPSGGFLDFPLARRDGHGAKVQALSWFVRPAWDGEQVGQYPPLGSDYVGSPSWSSAADTGQKRIVPTSARPAWEGERIGILPPLEDHLFGSTAAPVSVTPQTSAYVSASPKPAWPGERISSFPYAPEGETF